MEQVKRFLEFLKEKTNGGKTLAAVGALVLMNLADVDIAALTPAEWFEIAATFVLGGLGFYGYSDVKKRLGGSK